MQTKATEIKAVAIADEAAKGLGRTEGRVEGRRQSGASRPALFFVALAGAALALGVERLALRLAPAQNAARAADAPAPPVYAVAAPGYAVAATRAEAVLGELSADEVRKAARFVAEQTGCSGARDPTDAQRPWLAGPTIELQPPRKSAALAFVDGASEVIPKRFARVAVAVPARQEVVEYVVGPLCGPMTLTEVGVGATFSKRPTESGADGLLAAALVGETLRDIGRDTLEAAFGIGIFDVFPESYDPANRGAAASVMQNDALSPAGTRRDLYAFGWRPPAAATPSNTEAAWVHPVPLRVKIDSTAPDAADWFVVDIDLCGVWYATVDLLHASGRNWAEECGFSSETGTLPWEVPTRETLPDEAPPTLAEDHGVEWGDWSFTAVYRPSTGPALVDVRLKGERTLYELSLQDAMAAYSGDTKQAFFYADAAWSMSMNSVSLVPGVDCPVGATFLPATTWYDLSAGSVGGVVVDALQAQTFYPTCVFEWTEDKTIWRHMEASAPPKARGLVRKSLIVRSIATVGNYDYITDFKFMQDGALETSVTFAGYIEARHVGAANRKQESLYSTILRPDLAGPVHSHAACFKADFDVAGERRNALRITTVGLDDGDGGDGGFVNKVLATRDEAVENAFVADPRKPGVWTIVDRASVSAAGNARGFAVQLGSWATTQLLPADHPFTKATAYSKYHFAVTRHRDAERKATSPYAQYDGLAAAGDGQDLDAFLDGEAILDEDVVAWIGVGKEHVVRQEDLPLVSNFQVSFSIIPWNFFDSNLATN